MNALQHVSSEEEGPVSVTALLSLNNSNPPKHITLSLLAPLTHLPSFQEAQKAAHLLGGASA